MRIGIDLDNTIINYGPVFRRISELNGIPPDLNDNYFHKATFKQKIFNLQNGSVIWEKIQAIAYGPAINFAKPFDGIKDFLELGKSLGVRFFIVSHKTRFAVQDQRGAIDLRASALTWLKSNQIIVGQNIVDEDIWFTDTRAEKLQIISSLNLDWFIDDLTEVFEQEGFPLSVTKYLFQPEHLEQTDFINAPWNVMKSWGELYEQLKLDVNKFE